jgi:hypothetical protein
MEYKININPNHQQILNSNQMILILLFQLILIMLKNGKLNTMYQMFHNIYHNLYKQENPYSRIKLLQNSTLMKEREKILRNLFIILFMLHTFDPWLSRSYTLLKSITMEVNIYYNIHQPHTNYLHLTYVIPI